ncbi:MAG: PD40 domain-containing protein, partial [Bacteroidia bacterium]|nr:PD40 domain-containing protein [Bacteroidia bacterium]
KDKTKGDIYETIFQDNTWITPVKLEDHINTANGNEASACISKDGEFLFFSSDKPGGLGGKDLYRCKKLPNGKWSLPVNCGPMINTVYDEDAPFLSADDKVLYFSSKGHTTIGEFDIFKSDCDMEENSFSTPQNMGYPVNSVGDDIFFVICQDGYHGYYSSEKDNGFGGEDIYLIDMHYSENDVKVRAGYVYEKGAADSKPLKAKISLVDNETKQAIGYYTSNLRNGKFILLVSPFRTYSLNIEADGYKAQTLQVDQLTPENEEQEFKIELDPK